MQRQLGSTCEVRHVSNVALDDGKDSADSNDNDHDDA